MDHHLHASGIIPHTKAGHGGTSSSTQEHDWLCASQSVTCYPYANLLRDACWIGSGAKSKRDSLFQSHVWVTKVGNSSLQLGSMITVDTGDEDMRQLLPVATARRVFVRKSRSDGTVSPFLDHERVRFEMEGSADTSIQDILDQPLHTDNGSGRILPQWMDRLSNVRPNSTEPPHMAVRVGPQHINSGRHADHAFLAETAFQVFCEALGQGGAEANLPFEMKLTYVSEAMLGDTLECFVGNDGRVYLERSGSSDRSRETVLVAECQ